MAVLFRKITGMLAIGIFLSLVIPQIANALCPYGPIISLSIGVSKYDQVCSNQYQRFKFPVTSGRQYRVTVTPTSSSYDTDLYLGATDSVSNSSNYFARSTNGSGSVDTVTFTASSSTSTSGYTYAAVYAYSSGTLSYYIKVEDITLSAPNTPSTPSLSQISNGIRISWGSVSGATSYKIYWGTNSSVSETNYSGILTTSSTIYDHTGLDSEVTYYYRVMACNSAGCSGLSDIQSVSAPKADLTISMQALPTNINERNAQLGTTYPITCTVNRTGGRLRPTTDYVRVYIYMNQSTDPSTVLPEHLVLENTGTTLDFPVTELDDGTETKTDFNIPIPTTIEGPHYIHVKVDGPDYWSESNEDNNWATSSNVVAVWRDEIPTTASDNGILVRTWDNSHVYWISKYGKKWLLTGIESDPNSSNPGYPMAELGYTDADVHWYRSGALDSLEVARDILKDNNNFVYRRQGSDPEDSTVFIVRNGVSDWFFNWDTFINSEFGTEDVYWATDTGFDWIQLFYPPGQMIGLFVPPTLKFPVNNATLPIGQNITFQWVNSSSSVTNSSIKVCTNPLMDMGCQTFETGLTQTIVSDSLFTPGVKYYWQARSRTSTSAWGVYGPSPPRSFTVGTISFDPVFVPLFRLYKNSINDHYYTTISAHRDDYVNINSYTYEKVECYISDRPFNDPLCGPLYHLWDTTNDIHFYTSDEAKRTAKINDGFTDQGIVGYLYTAPSKNMIPLVHAEHVANTDHFYTVSKFEFDNAVNKLDFVDRGIVGYVSPTGLIEQEAHSRPQANFGGVDLGSGAYRGLNSLDLAMRGSGPSLGFSHHYNSYNFNQYPMGQGWSHSLCSYIVEDLSSADPKVFVIWGNGTISEFTKTGTGAFDYTDETGNHDSLELVNDPVNDPANYGYNIKRKNQTIYQFRRFNVYPYGKNRIALLSVEDWKENKLTFDYQNVTTVSDDFGRKLQLNYYYPSGLLHKVEEVVNDTVKRSVVFAYNDRNLLDAFTDARGKTTSYVYYEEDTPRNNLLKTVTYPRGNCIEIDYDDLKRVNSIKVGDDPASLISYTPASNTTIVTDPRVKTYTVTHSDFCLTSRQGQGDPDPDTFVYGDSRNPTKPTHYTDKEGNTTDIEYDAMGNVAKITNADDKIATYTYNSKNNIERGTEFHAVGTSITPTIYIYDCDGNRLRSIENPEYETTSLNYDPNHQVTSHQVTSIQNGRGFLTHFAYGIYGNLGSITDAEGNVTTYTNDYAGRTTQVVDGKNKSTLYTYDPTDNLTSVKNHLNHIVQLFQNDNGFMDYVTWLNNGVTALTDYDYDSEDRLKFVANPLTSITSFTYNESGNLENRNDYNGVATTYQYDENNRLKMINYPGDVDDISVGRDNNGSITSVIGSEGESKFEYNELNLIKKYTDPYWNIVQYEYNDAGRLKTLTYPGGKTVTYGYDRAGRLKTVQDWIIGSNPTTYEYDDAGNLTRIFRANNTEVIYSYDDASRLTGITEQKIGGAAICSYVYALDGVGNHYSVTATEPLTGSVLPKDVTCAHDKANRLLSAGSITYTYDNNGNRMTSTDAGGTTYTWNHENMLTGIVENSPSRSVQYQYDGMNNRIARIEGNTKTKYVLDLSGDMSRVLAETDENGTIQAYYVYGLGLISRITPDKSRYFYHYNNRGDTIALTDVSGSVTDSYAYDEYGQLLESTGSTENPFKFVGQYGVMDEGDDLYFMRARFYDAEVGRFLSEDPLGFGGGDWNLYAYVRGNPVMGVDPSGCNILSELGWKGLNVLADPGKFVFSEAIEFVGKAGSRVLKKTGFGTEADAIDALIIMNKGMSASGEEVTQAGRKLTKFSRKYIINPLGHLFGWFINVSARNAGVQENMLPHYKAMNLE